MNFKKAQKILGNCEWLRGIIDNDTIDAILWLIQAYEENLAKSIEPWRKRKRIPMHNDYTQPVDEFN